MRNSFGQSYVRRHRKYRTYGIFGSILLVLAVFGGCFAYTSAVKGTIRDVTFTVTDKERVCDGGQDGTCRYLVYTDEGTFAITDAHNPFVFWRTNSADVYGRVKENTTYDAKVMGWRFGFNSSYPNIMSLEEVQ